MKESGYKSYEDLPLFLNGATVAKVLGVSGLRLLEDPELIRMAWENFHENQQVPYVSPLPLDLKPDFT